MNANPIESVLILGGSGFIGRALGEYLWAEGFPIRLVTRQKPSALNLSFPAEIYEWDGCTLDDKALNGVKAVVNLAGESVADSSWSKKYKHRIYSSRIETTRALARAVTKLDTRPSVVIQVSAIGYYGMRVGETDCNEISPPGHDYLAQVCVDWEKEAQAMEGLTRLSICRLGVVLGWGGGAWPKLWGLYQLGLGAQLGSGEQWMNGVALGDVLSFIHQAIIDHSYRGVFNLVASENMRNKEFHPLLAKQTHSFSFAQAPSSLVRFFLRERADLILGGPKVIPKKLQDRGFPLRSMEAIVKVLGGSKPN